MGNLFAKSGRSISEGDKAVLALKTQRRKLTLEQRRVEDVLQQEVNISRQLVASGKPDRALVVLRKKRLQQARLKDLDNWLLKVEQMLGDVEATRHTNDVFLALKQGHATLQKLQQEVTIQDVERLMDDSAETKALQDEVNKALDVSLTNDEEEAAAAELSEMQALHPIEHMPDVPRHKLPQSSQQQEATSNTKDIGNVSNAIEA